MKIIITVRTGCDMSELRLINEYNQRVDVSGRCVSTGLLQYSRVAVGQVSQRSDHIKSNNNNTSICKAHIVSIRAESEAPKSQLFANTIIRNTCKKLSCRWQTACGWPLDTRPFPTCYNSEFGPSRSKWYERPIGDPPEKKLGSRPAFQGHSRSSELTRIDHLPMTSY